MSRVRIMALDDDDPSKLPSEVRVTLVKRADGSVEATWHDAGFREWFERSPPGVMGDEGVMLYMDTPELIHRYAARFFQRSQLYAVVTD
jgi:hypothetical protein